MRLLLCSKIDQAESTLLVFYGTKTKDNNLFFFFFPCHLILKLFEIFAGELFWALMLCILGLRSFFCFLCEDLEGLNRLVLCYFEVRPKRSQSNKLLFWGKVVKIIPCYLSLTGIYLNT